MTSVDPLIAFGGRLASIAKPSRYLGGEPGSVVKPGARWRVGLCFPDLYEIGMANNAMRILYSGLNALDGVACERVFSAAPDFRTLLVETGTPLYGLESGTPLGSFDMVAFTVGYELAATNVIEALRLGGVPILAKDRGEGSPIVIAGGPAITNPLPYSEIIDAVWIGEAENAFFDLAAELAVMKAAGAGRPAMIERLGKERCVWMPGKGAVRNIFSGFSDYAYDFRFPQPNVRPVQDHGVVEIMRGCPNGCRFCHAGYFYRPTRYRSVDRIIEAVDALVDGAGQRDISLSSLSSGDYPDIVGLVRLLRGRYAGRGVSFQLPSLKVESLPLEIVEELSETKRSGLTFAVETPIQAGQSAINKAVSLEKIHALLREALAAGYKLAKLYFMIGLPVAGGLEAETGAIIEALKEMTRKVPSIRLNCTVATFVPKPHTPFERCGQLEPDEAQRAIFSIKDAMRSHQQIKISYHSPYLSWLEGIVARGDERVGRLLLLAQSKGASFDAWDDLFDKGAWEEALAKFPDIRDRAGREWPLESRLPWSAVSVRVSPSFFAKERVKAGSSIFTDRCAHECPDPCGACGPSRGIDDDAPVKERIALMSTQITTAPSALPDLDSRTEQVSDRFLFRFSKAGRAAFIAHHDLYSMIAKSIELSGLEISRSHGFHPMPRMELSEPMALGFGSEDEYGLVRLSGGARDDYRRALEDINDRLHADVRVVSWDAVPIREGVKAKSLSSLHWGSLFLVRFDQPKLVDECIRNLTLLRDEIDGLSALEASLGLSLGAIELLLPFLGRKEASLRSLIARAAGEGSGYSALRLRQFARAEDGTKTDYLSALLDR